MAYAVTLSTKAIKAVQRLPSAMKRRVEARLEELSHEPRGANCIKLRGMNAYRTRVGDYRIVYEIYDNRLVVLVLDIDDRKDVYRRK